MAANGIMRMDGGGTPVTGATEPAGPETIGGMRVVVSPSPGHPLVVAVRDIAEAFRFAPVWLHAGWIDVVWRFRRTRLGPLWHTLGLGVFVFVMGVIWGTMLEQDPREYFRYIGTSLIVWTLVAAFVTEGSTSIISGQATAESMRFPYVAFTFGHVWRALLLFAHHAVLYVVILVGTLYVPSPVALIAIPGLLLVVANGAWMSLLMGMISLRRRDLVPAAASAMQIMMFVTPVFWPKDRLGPELAYVADLNPLYHLIRVVRDPLLGTVPPWTSWAFVAGTLVVGSTLTLWLYGRYRDRFAYWY